MATRKINVICAKVTQQIKGYVTIMLITNSQISSRWKPIRSRILSLETWRVHQAMSTIRSVFTEATARFPQVFPGIPPTVSRSNTWRWGTRINPIALRNIQDLPLAYKVEFVTRWLIVHKILEKTWYFTISINVQKHWSIGASRVKCREGQHIRTHVPVVRCKNS